MNATSKRTDLVALSLVLASTLGLTGCAAFFGPTEPAEQPRTEPAAASPSPSAATVESAAPAAAPVAEEPAKGPMRLALDPYGLAISIEVPAGTSHKAETILSGGGANVGARNIDAVSVRVFKADASIKTLSAAKKRRKVPGCDAQPIVKEGPDHYIYNCKMRSMETMDLLVITELKGVTYACESSASKVEDLDLQLAACRTLQPL